MSSPCWFCGATGVKITKQHVFPRWARDIYPTEGDLAATNVSNIGGEPQWEIELPRGPATKLTVRNVCEKCNNGWMGSLEEEAEPLIRAMIAGDRLTLARPQWKTLARWAIQTAYVFESLNADSARSQPAQRATFMRRLAERDPYVVLAFRRKTATRGIFRTLPIPSHPKNPKYWLSCTFIQLNQLLFQVWIKSTRMAGDVSLQPVPVLEDATLLWPNARYALIPWPPRRTMTEDEYYRLLASDAFLLSGAQRAARVEVIKNMMEERGY
jgi:hypothetical protein